MKILGFNIMTDKQMVEWRIEERRQARVGLRGNVRHNLKKKGLDPRLAGLPLLPPKYPFAELAVGDSFFFDYSQHVKVSNAAGYYAHRNDKKFVTKKQSPTMGKVTRIK